MLHLYTYLKSFEDIRSLCDIDLSRVSSESLADECDRIFQHHKKCVIFMGYLEPGWMLDNRHEARIRNCIRKFEVHLICFHIESIPYSWKNEIDTVYLKDIKDGPTEAIDNGSSILFESKTEHKPLT